MIMALAVLYMHHSIHTFNFGELWQHIKTVEIKVSDIRKGDIVTSFITDRAIDGSVRGIFGGPWMITKIKKRKYSITFYDQCHGSLELPINIARPNALDQANTVYIIPRTFLKKAH
jgi:hypothetical protein